MHRQGGFGNGGLGGLREFRTEPLEDFLGRTFVKTQGLPDEVIDTARELHYLNSCGYRTDHNLEPYTLWGKLYFRQEDLEISRIVNPDGKELCAIAPGMGSSIERILLQSNARHVIGLDLYHYLPPGKDGRSVMDWMNEWDPTGEREVGLRGHYFRQRWLKGFCKDDLLMQLRSLYIPLGWELQDMRADVCSSKAEQDGKKDGRTLWDIGIEWQHPMDDKPSRRDIFLFGGADLDRQQQWIGDLRDLLAEKGIAPSYYAVEGMQGGWGTEKDLLINLLEKGSFLRCTADTSKGLEPVDSEGLGWWRDEFPRIFRDDPLFKPISYYGLYRK